MPATKDAIRLQHMRDYASEAVEMSTNTRREELEANRMLNLALVRLLEVIGEAAAKVTEETREANPDLPWSQMTGLRNRLIHGYDAVDFDILWDVLKYDLPPLIQRLDEILHPQNP